MASNEAIDMKTAVRYLEALQRVAILFNDSEAATNLKKNIKIWDEKLDKDEEAKDEKKKKEAVGAKK